jgi:hypothetical protein
MNTAIIFNLNYETQPIVKCRELWTIIETRMAASGFTKSGRIFLTTMDPEAAFKQARGVMEFIEHEYRAKGQSAMSYLRDFYGIPYAQIVDLAKPPAQAIEVDMMASGAFQRFFS